MEPITLTTVVTAIATIFLTKVIEKPGENLGQLLWDKTQNLMVKLKGTSSQKVAGLLEGSPEQPLNIGEAVLEIKALAEANPELAEAIQEVEAEANKESNAEFQQKLQQKLQEIQEETNQLNNQQLVIQNLTKLAEKINNLNQAQSITIYQTKTL
jgi:LPS O-antigen subunit length determinant protein (WzzB/FepE family)